MDDLAERCSGVPPLFDELRKVILEECISTEGIFRRTPGVSLTLTQGIEADVRASPQTGHCGYSRHATGVTAYPALARYRNLGPSLAPKDPLEGFISVIDTYGQA
jgi:hypothetical protein